MSKSFTEQKESFITGTIAQFSGLVFITIMPYLLNLYGFNISFYKYKIAAFILFSIAMYFYWISPDYKYKQLFIIGLNFTFLALFQLVFSSFSLNHYFIGKIIALLVGLTLILLSYKK